MAGVSSWSSRWPSRLTFTLCGSRYDPLRAGLRLRPRLRQLVSEFRRLRQAAQAVAGDVSPLRFGEGRESNHGAQFGVRLGARGGCRAATARPVARAAHSVTAAPATGTDAGHPAKTSGGDDGAGARAAAEA